METQFEMFNDKMEQQSIPENVMSAVIGNVSAPPLYTTLFLKRLKVEAKF